MSNEKFRSELSEAFDKMTGSPSPTLPDRVGSSIAKAPEWRGPYWIAALAAAVIAALIVGVLFVANPRHRPLISVGPGPSPSLAPHTPSATPPEARGYASFVFERNSGYLLMFGGYHAPGTRHLGMGWGSLVSVG